MRARKQWEWRFSRHALRDSLPNRTLLSPGEIIEIVENGLSIPIGVEGKKRYELFYSIKDDDWFVIVINKNTREVITLLPVDYSRWLIDDSAKETAREMALTGIRDLPIKIPAAPNRQRFSFRSGFFAVLDNGHEQRLRVEFHIEPQSDESKDINCEKFWLDPENQNNIRQEILRLNLPLDRIVSLVVKSRPLELISHAPEEIFNQIIRP